MGRDDSDGAMMLALITEAKAMYPKDPQAQAKYVSRKVAEKRKTDSANLGATTNEK